MPTLTPQIIGRAENAHKPLMDHALADSGVTFAQWVCLTLIADGTADGTADVAARVAAALKIAPTQADEALGGLRGQGLITQTDGLTAAGAETFSRIRQLVESLVGRIYADIDEADLAVAARVLTTITARADAAAAELPER